MKAALGIMHFTGEGGLQEHLAMVFLLRRNRPFLAYPVEFSPDSLARDVETVLFPIRARLYATLNRVSGIFP